MLKLFEQHIDFELPFLRNGRLLLAVSGGRDSCVLTHLCHELELEFAIAHCNFNLRGEDSDGDARFVEQLGEKLGREVFIQDFDTKAYAENEGLSIQMAARELRYDWFNELAKQSQFDFILTAHHADDNLETFLINLSRGTGLDGLTGIPEINKNIVRPLLPFSQQQIEDYALENNLKWREDQSNSDTKYVRNLLRHEVVPKLKKAHPEFLNNFKRTLEYLNQAADVVDDRMDEIADAAIDVKPDGIYFDISKIKALNNPQAYLFQLLNNYGFTEWNDIYGLLNAQSGKKVLSKDWMLFKDRQHLILTQLNESHFESIYIQKGQSHVSTSQFELMFTIVNKLGTESNAVYVDADQLQFPLVLRQWRKGDVFNPIGLGGKKKKLSKFFKDEKYSLIEKDAALLLCSGNEIVWLVGKRMDERFKVMDNTKTILKIEFANASSKI